MPYGPKKVQPYFSRTSLGKLRDALSIMRISQLAFAKEIGKHPQTVSKWFNRKERLPRIVAKYIVMRLAYTRLLARLERRRGHLYLRGELVGGSEMLFDPVKPVEESGLLAGEGQEDAEAPEPVKEVQPIDPFSGNAGTA